MYSFHGVFCLDACVIEAYKRETLSVVTITRDVDSQIGARGNILAGLQTFSQGPSGKKNV